MPELPPAVRGFGVTFATMFKKVVTEEYPEQADRYPPKPRFHGRHHRGSAFLPGRAVRPRLPDQLPALHLLRPVHRGLPDARAHDDQ